MGEGKGRSKGKDSWRPPPSTTPWVCCWAGCKAAQQQKPTFLDNSCFVCQRLKSRSHFGSSPSPFWFEPRLIGPVSVT